MATPLRPACPGVIPRIPNSHGLVVSGPRRVNQFWVFDLEHGAPSDSTPRRSRPPGVLHVTIYTGNIGQANGAMAYPGTRRNARLRSEIVAEKRSKPLLFGPVSWSGKRGALFLAPSYPVGGQIGGHLAFWWKAHGTNYLISMHAWEPLTECEKVLQAIVASTDAS
jgi:hypothetical protein